MSPPSNPHNAHEFPECRAGIVSCDVKTPERSRLDTFDMDQGAPTAVLAARLANHRPRLVELAAQGHPRAFDQAWKLLDPIFLDAERQGLGGSCYTLIGKLLEDIGLTRTPHENAQ